MPFRNRSVDASRFSMVPRADVPRSTFRTQSAHKTTFNAGDLVPVYVDEVLPGDSHRLRMTALTRISTLIFPVMDNLRLDSFYFFVPNRLVWSNFERFMGEKDTPGSSTDFLTPQHESPSGGYTTGSLQDYFGLPTNLGAGETVFHSALPLRAYNLIWNEWFRDQNLSNSAPVPVDNGPDPTVTVDFVVRKRAKRHDYFTSCLPWPQKDTSMGTVPGSYLYAPGARGAPVTGIGATTNAFTGAPTAVFETGNPNQVTYPGWWNTSTDPVLIRSDPQHAALPDIRVTINSLRLAFQMQKLQERDARGGTRYVELIRSHFGVISPDARLQRPEYLGGGSSAVLVNPVVQTSATAATPQGHLTGVGTGVAQGHGFSQSFTEHGWIIGLVCVRADVTYQQGLHKMWSRRSKYDFYWPAFAHLGEQAVLNKEIKVTGVDVDDELVFGYQERWAEYRHMPSRISGFFRSSASGTLDSWHFSQNFVTTPVLAEAFILDGSQAVVERALSAGAAANLQQFLFDSFFDVSKVRPIPSFSVPGLADHF